MTRKKVKLEWIVNDSARKASLKKRRLGLLKKVRELTTLCGVEAFVIIYSPDEVEPMTWPPSRSDVDRLIMRYISMPEMERLKKLTNQESYVKERTVKVHEQSKRSHQKNNDNELSYLMSHFYDGKGLDNFEVVELNELDCLINDRMKNLRKRIEYFQRIPPLDEHHHTSENVDMGGGEGRGGTLQGQMNQNLNEPISWDQWLLDMVHDSEANIGGSSKKFSSRDEFQMGFQNSPQRFGPYGPVDMSYNQLYGNTGSTGMTMYPSLNLEGDELEKIPYVDMMTSGNPFGQGFLPSLPSPYHIGNGGGNDSVDIGMHGFYRGGGGGGGGCSGVGPSAPTGSVRPHGDGGSNQIGLPSYEVPNPCWPNNSKPYWPKC